MKTGLITSALAAFALLSASACAAPEQPPFDVAPVAMCETSEPGERIDFFIRVLDENGRPLEKAAIIAYSTDIHGLYVPRGHPNRNPRIRAVGATDENGWCRFTSIKPGAYPSSDVPAHIHLHVDAPVHRLRYLEVWFEGDPKVTPALRRNMSDETIIVEPERNADGAWTFAHEVRLRGS